MALPLDIHKAHSLSHACPYTPPSHWGLLWPPCRELHPPNSHKSPSLIYFPPCTFHGLTYVYLIFLQFILSFPLWCKHQEGRNICGYCSLLHLQHPGQCLLGNRNLITISQLNILRRILNVCSVAQLCLTLCDPRSPPGSSVHGIIQARILEWVAFPSQRILNGFKQLETTEDVWIESEEIRPWQKFAPCLG